MMSSAVLVLLIVCLDFEGSAGVNVETSISRKEKELDIENVAPAPAAKSPTSSTNKGGFSTVVEMVNVMLTNLDADQANDNRKMKYCTAQYEKEPISDLES